MQSSPLKTYIIDPFKNLSKVILRFPLVIPLIAFATWDSLYGTPLEILGKKHVSSLLIPIIHWIILHTLWGEATQPSEGKKISVGILGVLLGGYLGYSLSNFPYLILNLGLWLGIYIAPYIYEGSQKAVSKYVIDTFMGLILSFFGALILLIGINGIGLALNLLFAIDLYQYNWFTNLSWMSFLFVWPVLFLSQIPRDFSLEQDKAPKWANLLIPYLAIPLLLIYGAILYAYCGTILIAWELPKGVVSYVVAGYVLPSLLVYHGAYLISDENKIVGFFRKHCFKLLIFPLGLMGVAVYTRVHGYGVTPERFMLIVFLVWAAFNIGYMAYRRNEYSLKAMIGSVCVLFVLGSFGPWGMMSVSNWSQKTRLQEVLEKNNMFQNTLVNPAKAKVSQEDMVQVSSLFEYFSKHDQLDVLLPWFKDLPQSEINLSKSPNVSKIVEGLNLSFTLRNANYLENQVNVYNPWISFTPLDISAYHTFLNIGYVDGSTSGEPRTLQINGKPSKLSATVLPKSSKFRIQIDSNPPFEVDTEIMAKNWTQKTDRDSSNTWLTLDSSNPSGKIKIVVNSFYGTFEGSPEVFVLSSIDLALFLGDAS